MRMRHIAGRWLVVGGTAVALTVTGSFVAAGATPGSIVCNGVNGTDLYVSDVSTFGNPGGGVIHVDSLTGTRTTLSENANPLGGPDFETPTMMAFEASGDIVVAEAWSTLAAPRFPAVIRVSRTTGVRTLVSDNANPVGGPDLFAPSAIAIEASGAILITNTNAVGNGGVIRVDPVTGVRTAVSRNGAPAGAPSIDAPFAMAVAANGDILVLDADTFPGGSVVRVNPVTGARTLLSDNASPAGGPNFVAPWGMTLDAAGSILVSDREAFGGNGGIIRVDPVTGARTTVSKNNAPAGGPSFQDPAGLVSSCGQLYVVDFGTDAVLKVNPASGVRTLVSDNATPAGQPDLDFPWGIVARPRFTLPGPGGPTTSVTPTHPSD